MLKTSPPGIKDLNRRRFCQAGALTLVGLAIPTRVLAKGIDLLMPERALSFLHLHTGEKLDLTTYRANGVIQQDALNKIFHILRDHRTDEVAEIDLNLLDQLVLLNQNLGNTEPLHIISGFRSQKTNEYLMRKSQGGGVAKYSLHMEGRAIDIRVPGLDVTDLHKAAASLKLGGVGLYPGLKFVHMDTGQIKYWQG